jgi:phage gp36-like protein
MAYATIDDVFSRYKPIRTMVGVSSFEVASLDVSSIFIFDAEAMVDAYVGVKYATPISPVGGLITKITSDLAIFAMLADKHTNVPDIMTERYDRSIELLKMIRDGEMTLGSSVSVATGGDDEAFSTTEDYHPVFSPVLDELDQKVDIDRVNDEKDIRANDV